MAKLRSEVVDLQNTTYYHCITRCVRREFLLNNIEKELKKKETMEKRIFKLKECFAVNILAYSIMDNHYHVALQVDESLIQNMTDDEILERWTSVFKGHECVQKYLNGDDLFVYEEEIVKKYIQEYRRRMTDISWFMKTLNEHIAKKANKEDNVKGHFWEHRFLCIPIIGRERLLETMAYIDLNPLRAAVVKTPENGEFTSLKRRVELLKLSKIGISFKDALNKKIKNSKDEIKKDLLQHIEITNEDLGNSDILKAFGFESCKGYLLGLEPLEDDLGNILRNHIDLSCEEYLKFVDQEGRKIREDKKGFIAQNESCIIERIFRNQTKNIA